MDGLQVCFLSVNLFFIGSIHKPWLSPATVACRPADELWLPLMPSDAIAEALRTPVFFALHFSSIKHRLEASSCFISACVCVCVSFCMCECVISHHRPKVYTGRWDDLLCFKQHLHFLSSIYSCKHATSTTPTARVTINSEACAPQCTSGEPP